MSDKNVNQYEHELSEYLKCRSDLKYFTTNYFKLVGPKGELPFDLWQSQKEFQDHLTINPFSISLSARQTGGSSLLAAYAMWRALFWDYKLLVVAPNLSQSKGFMEIINRAFDRLPKWLQAPVRQQTNSDIFFSLGSIRIAAAGKSCGKGMSLDGVIFLETSYIPDNRLGDTLESLLPTFIHSNHPTIVIHSSGYVPESRFHRLWIDANAEKGTFIPFKLTMDSVPNRDDEWKQRMQSLIGSENWEREFALEHV